MHSIILPNIMKKLLASISLSVLPVVAFAAEGDVYTILGTLQGIVNAIIPFIIGLAVLVFIYGVFNFVTSAGDEEARAGAKQLIIWGVIGIFVMVSVWGLVNILVQTFGISDTPASAVQNPFPAGIIE